MESICQDVLNIIFVKCPFDIMNLALTCKFFHSTFISSIKKKMEKNYLLSEIQQRIIGDMLEHIENIKDKKYPLILQSNVSTGKTAAILAFAISKYKGTVVIQTPLSTIPQYESEIAKIYGPNMLKSGIIAIAHNNYNKASLVNKWKNNWMDPSKSGHKVFIMTSTMQSFSQHTITRHSIIIIDEVHTVNGLEASPRIIGLTASKVNFKDVELKVYLEEEKLPQLIPIDVISNPKNYTRDNMMKSPLIDTVITIMAENKGPFLAIGKKYSLCGYDKGYITYDGTFECLKMINAMDKDELALLVPGRQSTGINLVNIGCIIYLNPAVHENNTVIQSIARATRVTSKNREIKLFNVHCEVSDVFICKTYVSENEIIKFCEEGKIGLLKNPRNKDFIRPIINSLLRKTTYEKLREVPNIYFALLLRIQKGRFEVVRRYMAENLGIPYGIVENIIS